MQQDNNNNNNPNQAMVNTVFGSVFGNVEQHINSNTQHPSPTTQHPSPVYLAKEPRGFKIDLIRVVNVLYMLGFFTGKNGAKVTKKEVFTAIGKALNIDLST